MQNSTFSRLLWLFYLPLIAPMSAFPLAGIIGFWPTTALLSGILLIGVAALVLGYSNKTAQPSSDQLRRSGAVFTLIAGAGFAAAAGYNVVTTLPFTGTSLLLALLCVAAYSLFVSLAISLPAIDRERNTPKQDPVAKPKVATIVLTPDGKPQVIVTRMKRGMPPQLPNTGGNGGAVPAPKPAPKSDNGSGTSA
ncbi:MAG: hypothetical protein GC134_09035 [Proteobacteria bacterium]|nr:hypothetical protein [Pseudomonadota bacterium]